MKLLSNASALISLISGIITLLNTVLLVRLLAFVVFAICLLIVIWNNFKSPYEFKIKTRKIIVDILDETGKKAVCQTSSTIEIIKNNTFNYVESIICDGKTNDIKSKIGTIENIRREKGHVVVKTTLGHKRDKGDILDVGLSYTCIDSYVEDQEYYHYTQLYPGEQVHIIIIFPYNRPLIDYFVEMKIGHYRKNSPYKLTPTRYNNKNAIELVIPKIEINQSYCITWRW